MQTDDRIARESRVGLTDLLCGHSLPDEIRECLKEQVAEFHCGLFLHPEWPVSWHKAKLSRAAERALKETMKAVIEKALEALPKKRAIDRWEAERAIENAFDKHFKSLVTAIRLPPKVRNWEAEIRRQTEEARNATEASRKELAAAKHEYREMMRGLTMKSEYPDVPDAVCAPSYDGTPLPEQSGVYFVWSKGRVVYVGQSIRLCQRAKIGHERITVEDQLSWLEFPVAMLNFAEAFYIGVTRPVRNFGIRSRL